MAKADKLSVSADAPQSAVCSVDVHSLAAELFARHFVPRTDQTQPWKVAADCYVAAIEFVRVGNLIASGTSPDAIRPEIKNDPAPVAEPTESPAASQ
jgi:hypothetical protein